MGTVVDVWRLRDARADFAREPQQNDLWIVLAAMLTSIALMLIALRQCASSAAFSPSLASGLIALVPLTSVILDDLLRRRQRR